MRYLSVADAIMVFYLEDSKDDVRGNAKRKAAPEGAAFKGAQAMHRSQKGGVLPPP